MCQWSHFFSRFIVGTPLVHHPAILAFLTPYITVFARMSPQQKGDVIRVTKENGEFCLMCGDGTNDVAALKQAHCGRREERILYRNIHYE